MTHRILSLVFTFIILLATAGLGPVIRFRDAAEWKGPPQNAQPPKKMSVDKVDAENLKQRVPTR